MQFLDSFSHDGKTVASGSYIVNTMPVLAGMTMAVKEKQLPLSMHEHKSQ
jgi:hypothetical protein